MDYSKLLRINEYIGVSNEELKKRGIYNGYIFLDSPLFLNPKLLHNTDIREFKDAEKIIVKHYETTIQLLKNVKEFSDKDIFWKMAKQHFNFPEPKGVGLGTSVDSIDGNGLTGTTAERCLITFKEILNKDIEDCYIYRLLYLIQENVGVDRISDMLCSIIYDRLLLFTENKIKEMGLNCTTYTEYKGKKYMIYKRPNGKNLIFMPESLLTDIPDVADEYDIMSIVALNQDIKEYVSKYFEEANLNVTNLRNKTKEQMAEIILNNSDLIKLLLINVKQNVVEKYDFNNDPLDIYISNQKMYELLNRDIIKINKNECVDLHEVISQTIDRYKKCIEDLGLNEELYCKNQNGSRRPKTELTAHRFFIIMLEAVKQYNKIEYTFEAKAGNGQVEFIIFNMKEKILVEFKLNKNNLTHGYNIQLEEYIKRYEATSSFYVIIKVIKNDNVEKFFEEIKSYNKRKDVKVVDGLIYPVPSKL